MTTQVAIIGGTAAYSIEPSQFGVVDEIRTLSTPFGPSFLLHRLEPWNDDAGGHVWFASRHGAKGLKRTARFVNHRANIWALNLLGVTHVLTWNGVGAINRALRVTDSVVPRHFIDWTRSREYTFVQSPDPQSATALLRRQARTIERVVAGLDPAVTPQPFDTDSISHIERALATTPSASWAELPDLTYLCTEGPRLETAAEIRLAGDLGADVVGMTLSPEIWLAAELDLAYASICRVTNFATGLSHIDSRRNFAVEVAIDSFRILLEAAHTLSAGNDHE